MINNKLFRKTVEESKMKVERISQLTGIPRHKIYDLMEEGDTINAAEIQALSMVLNMSNPLRRNIFFNRNLPLD